MLWESYMATRDFFLKILNFADLSDAITADPASVFVRSC